MEKLISNVTIVTMNEKMDVLFGAFLGIDEGRICYIGKKPPEGQPEMIIDGTGMVAMPGLINCHTHLATTALRGLFDDANPREALEGLLQKEARMDARCAKASALMGIAECLRFGITSVSDLYYYPEAVAEAAAESGIKANIALSAYRFIHETEDFDFEEDPQCQAVVAAVEKWNGYDQGRIRMDAGIYAPYTSNHQLWTALSDYAAQEGLGFQLHLGQTREETEECLDRTGMDQGALLDCHGVFRVPVTATDGACLSEEDRKLLGKRHATLVATPIAAAMAGRPGTPITQSVQAGLNVALGTGGPVDSGNMDLFEVMRAAALSENPRLPSTAALMMATVCGARAQGRQEQCGMLKEGLDADLILVDFSAPHLIPCHNVLGSLVYSAKGSDVAMTMVRGRILYRNGQFPTMDLSGAVQELTGYVLGRLFDGPGGKEERHV